MKYDFESIIERHGKDAIAIDSPSRGDFLHEGRSLKEGFDIIPMWVADMNFPVVPSIQREVIKRMEHPCFGYFEPRDEYFDAIIDWHKRLKGVGDIKREYIGYENGVLGGLVSALRVLCSMGEKILVHSPTYVGFTNTLKNNGYEIIHSRLNKDESGVWRMDFEDMERKIIENKIHTAIFCSPHNPTGRVWEKREIEKAMEIYKKHDVYVISDEIWSDIIIDGNVHIPTQSISEDAKMRTIGLYAPTKTFSLAGFVGSYHVIYNSYLRDRVMKESSLSHYNIMNVLSMYALIGGYCDEGAEWVDVLRAVISRNVDVAMEYIDERFEGVEVSRPQGTYMMFIDCEKWCKANDVSIDELLQRGYEVGVIWQDGRLFRDDWSIRLNLALPTSRVKEAFDRLEKYVFCAVK